MLRKQLRTHFARFSACRALHTPVPVTVARGDGVGPEIMDSTLQILKDAGARILPEHIEIGEKVYRRGISAGIEDSAWESLRRTKVFLKAPITTPSGGGYKSLNVTCRKVLGLYANVRPCISYNPFIATKHPKMDVVIVRENEEDLYAGIEHRQSDQVYQCLKLVSRPGCEKIIRYAFEYVRANGRRKLTCMTKDNIMKMTDGLFHSVFNEIAAEYPDIQTEHYIIDIGAARIADTPERFDTIVTMNLYGDIISDIAAQITGSVGLGSSVNIGQHCSMFEAVHGSAPDIAGKNIANPSGLLLSAVGMLNHLGQGEVAGRIHNAWLRTIEEGIHTPDIFRAGSSKILASTTDFTKAVITRLGQQPTALKPASYANNSGQLSSLVKHITYNAPPPSKKELKGVDVFLHWNGESDRLGKALQKLDGDGIKLIMITNRGVKVYPEGAPETFCTDHWRCRFQSIDGNTLSLTQVVSLLLRVGNAGFDFVKTEHLYNFDGKPGYSLGQGQ